MQTQTSNTLHNAIMEAGSKDRPPMLARGNYVQWKSRIKRYIDTKHIHELIHYCLENPPYKLDWQDIEVLVSEGSPITTTVRIRETYKNVLQDIRNQLNAEAEAVQIILTGIDNDIYSTVDACSNACEMWKAIERLKQGELINVEDLEPNLYWEYGKFTSQDGESLESYYSRFYKMMNELIRNQCKVTNHQVNVQFLLQLQPEWQRFVTLVKQSQELKTVSYHKLSQQAATRNRGKAIVKSLQPIYDQEPSMVAEDEETSKDKEIDKLMALISLSFKKIYKPTNNNLRTSLNTNYEAFYFDNGHIKEISSGSTTTHSDISLSGYDSFIFDFANEEFAYELAHITSPPEYDCFYFRDLPDQGELMYVLNSRIRENLSTTLVNLPIVDDYSPLLAYVEFADELAHIISPPEYDCFYFWNLPDPGELISIFNSGIRENSSTTCVNLPVEDDYSPLLAYVV
nr:hypothetical protein [Tanacetum cinerariifolium]